ncbi:hypothetical protein M413DRAFT_28574, partial [Hebeloma cylindrosporum]
NDVRKPNDVGGNPPATSFDGERRHSSSIPSREPNDVARNPPPRRSFAVHPSPTTSFVVVERRVEPSREPNDVAGNPTTTSNPFPRTSTSFDGERTSSRERSDVVGGFAIANGAPSNETRSSRSSVVSFLRNGGNTPALSFLLTRQ